MDKAKMEYYMRLALKEGYKNLTTRDGGPFGACIVKKGVVIAVARNTVLKNDASCHAEINAIRKASRKLKSYDLSGCEIYSTTEPCLMCFGAIHWARIERIVYGTGVPDAERIGFNELKLRAYNLRRSGKSPVKIESGFMYKECKKLFDEWSKLKDKRLY
jgi:tRNA(Arg) A34 adenosine deaminase TadA